MDVSQINRTALAKATGTDLAHISRIFAGKAHPSLPLARKMAELLGISIEDLCKVLDSIKDDSPEET